MTAAHTFVYGLVDPRTLLVRYVGKTVSGMRRPRNHGEAARLKARTYCAAWVHSLHAAGLTYTIVVLEHGPKDQLSDIERWWIAYGRACGWPLTNLTDGGDGAPGVVRSAESRAAAAERIRGDRNPAKRPEVQAKISAATQGRGRGVPKSVATRARMSAAARRPRSDAFRQAMRERMLNQPPMSDVARAKCGEASRLSWASGQRPPMSPEQRAQISKRSRGMSAETRGKISTTLKQRAQGRRGYKERA